MMTTMKRHHFGITDRLGTPRCVRWQNIISVGPAMAALEAESKNPGWSAHEAYKIDSPADEVYEAGLAVWRVELWPHDG